MAIKEPCIRKTKKVSRFLRHLAGDLRLLGHRLSVQEGARVVRVILKERPETPDLHQVYERLYSRSLWSARADIQLFERQNRSALVFGDAKKLDVGRIEPELVICSTEQDLALFDYLRRYQTIVSNPCVGAQVKAIVYDRGQLSAQPVMGVIAVSSAMYFQGARDAYLGWLQPTCGPQARALRERGLKRCLQLSTCMALPPYDALRCGRLLAMLALSRDIHNAYQSRYGEHILGLTVTAGLRSHGVLYDRLHLPRLGVANPGKAHLFTKLRHEHRNRRYFTAAICNDTWEAARVLIGASAERSNGDRSAKERARIQTLRRAMEFCQLPIDLLRANDSVTYFGCVRSDYVECLRSGTCPADVESLAPEDVLAYWRSRFLSGAGRRRDRGDLENGALLSHRIRRVSTRKVMI